MDLDPAAVQAVNDAVRAQLENIFGKCELANVRAEWITAEVVPLIVRATADVIADKIRAEFESAWKAWGNYGGWSTYATAYGEAERIARAHGRTPETDTTEATE